MTTKDFSYSNLPVRPAGKYVRIGTKLLPGVRKVQNEIVPYALSWQQHNTRALNGNDPLWVVLGDSMSQGIGAGRYDRGWVGQLAARLEQHGKRYRVINLSTSGARIRDVIDRQLPALAALGLQPNLITVMVGANDLVKKKLRQNALTEFATLLDKLPAGSVVANLAGNRPVSIAMNNQLQRAVHDRHLVLADMRLYGPKTWRDMVAEDHFHPNEAGYQVIADVFARAIDA